MTNHPLTDGMIEDIVYENIYSDESVRTGGLGLPKYHDGRVMLRYADMRSAYDLAIEKITEQWENAVQSDLEHGVRSLNERYTKELISKYPKISSFGEVLEAMRPQENDS